MFSLYVPEPIYERLPKIYFLLAAVLMVAPLAPIKWIAIVALLLALAITRHQRQVYRAAARTHLLAKPKLADQYRIYRI